MQEKSIKHFKDNVREKEKREVVLAEDTGQPWLTVSQAAARVGMAKNTLLAWISRGVIPKPRKWFCPRWKSSSNPERPVFRREYVERLLNLMIIRASTNQYRSIKSVRNLCWKQLFGLR